MRSRDSRHTGAVGGDGPGARREPQAGPLVDAVLDFLGEVNHRVAAIAARHELTAQQAMLLRRLGSGDCSMGSMAENLSCDPSNVTGLIDRLERLGFVERVPDADDRRIRRPTLTPAGRRTRDRIERELRAAAVPMDQLDEGDVERLRALLARMSGGGPPSASR